MGRVRSRRGAPGIADVAARAGVSIATVSRAFGSPDLVRPSTRERIERAAEHLGYLRDRLSGSLQNRFSGTVGMVLPTIDNAIFAEMIEAFSTHLNELSRTMLLATHGYDLSFEVAIVRALLKRRIDGVVLIGLDHHEVPLAMLRERRVPMISVWNFRADAALPCIGADNQAAGAAVTRHLIGLGHQDIGFLFPETGSNDRARDRMTGALTEAAAAGLSVAPERIGHCPYDVGAAKRLAENLLSTDPPTAFVCGNDIIAHGVVYACHAHGVAVPEHLSVVGIGDFRGSAHMEPGLTTVRIPARRIGALAADAIVFTSETGRLPATANRAVAFSLVERNSTSRPRTTRHIPLFRLS